ncbi:MAG: type III-A CRISPR-associated RAMP protein Csm3, partial [Nitrososphaeria archaeon]
MIEQSSTQNISLIGKVIVTGDIIVRTGLRIGGTTTGLKIGGVDQPVITDALGRPYIPGSSLKGKMRSLIEKKEKVILNKKDKQGNPISHECDQEGSYSKCSVCKIWGILGTEKIKNTFTLTRLIVRDVYLDESSITEEMRRNLELKYTEIKMETAINRSTGTALGGSLRTMERVPAGAIFRPFEIIYNVYEEDDKKILVKVFESMELLEHDYLGGMGSRGYGKIVFNNITVFWNKKQDYETGNLNQTKIFEGKLTE